MHTEQFLFWHSVIVGERQKQFWTIVYIVGHITIQNSSPWVIFCIVKQFFLHLQKKYIKKSSHLNLQGLARQKPVKRGDERVKKRTTRACTEISWNCWTCMSHNNYIGESRLTWIHLACGIGNTTVSVLLFRFWFGVITLDIGKTSFLLMINRWCKSYL